MPVYSGGNYICDVTFSVNIFPTLVAKRTKKIEMFVKPSGKRIGLDELSSSFLAWSRSDISKLYSNT